MGKYIKIYLMTKEENASAKYHLHIRYKLMESSKIVREDHFLNSIDVCMEFVASTSKHVTEVILVLITPTITN